MDAWQETPLLNSVVKHSIGRRLLTYLGSNLVEKRLSVAGHEIKLILDLNDRAGVSKHILRHGDYDSFLFRLIGSFLPEKARAIDVGANIGVWSIFLSQVCGCEWVWAFEPAPQNLALLETNVALNRLHERVRVEACALGALPQQSRLYISEDNAGDHRLYVSSAKRTTVDVRVESFDELYPAERVDFVKIDTQGYEPFVLKGLTQTLRANPEVKVVMEFWPIGIRAAGGEPRALLTHLVDLGFKIWAVEPNRDRLIKADPDSVMRICPGELHTDLILSRSELALAMS